MKAIIRQMSNILVFVFIFFVIASIDFYKPNQSIEVYTTNYPLKHTIEQIGGENVEVTSIYEKYISVKQTYLNDEGNEEIKYTLDYKPTKSHTYIFEKDTKEKLFNSDLYLYSGYSFENKYLQVITNHPDVDKLDIRDVSKDIKKVSNTEIEEAVSVTNFIESVPVTYNIDLNRFVHSDIEQNPNIWYNPINMLQVAVEVKEVLKEKLPTKVEEIEKNFYKYKGSLLRLDSKIQNVINNSSSKLIIIDKPILSHLQVHGLREISFNSSYNIPILDKDDFEDLHAIMEFYGIEHIVSVSNDRSDAFNEFVKLYDIKVVNLSELDILEDYDYVNGDDYITLMYRAINTLEQILK